MAEEQNKPQVGKTGKNIVNRLPLQELLAQH